MYQGTWLIYLRKSRQDDPDQTVEEVLAKHETMLQEYAEREFGGRIPEENIYREVVSGESIDDRVEIKKVLTRIEDPSVTGVLVIEPQRLSRGDLEDCGRLMNAFRFTHTQVGTPMMVYDLEKKMERKFFQDELLRGRDYLEYTKEILWRGRVAAAKRGCFVGQTPPLGYNRVKLGRDWTLEANDDAELVRTIFDWYVKEDVTFGAIARRLNSMGCQSPKGGTWSRETIRNIIENLHYIGKIKYNEIKTTCAIEHGERVLRYVKQPDEDIIISEGKHSGIIDPAIFEAAQAKTAAKPRVKTNHGIVNPFASVLRCEKCGKVMVLDSGSKTKPRRYVCRTVPRCYKSSKVEIVEKAVLDTLKYVTLPNIERKLKNGDGNAASVQRRRIEKLSKQMDEYRMQEDKQYELLETGKYTQELFDRRNAALREKMENCEKQIHQARSAIPENVDYGETIINLKETIATLEDPDATPKEKNSMLRSMFDKIDYSFSDGNIRLDVYPRLRKR